MPPTYDIVGANDDDASSAYDDAAQKVNAKNLPLHYAGSGPLTIAGNASATFSFNLNMQLRPDHLVIPDAVAPNVAVSTWTIGAISLNAAADPAPGDMFRRDSTVRLRAAVSGTPSVPIKITLLNLTSGSLTGVYLGVAGPCKRVNG